METRIHGLPSAKPSGKTKSSPQSQHENRHLPQMSRFQPQQPHHRLCSPLHRVATVDPFSVASSYRPSGARRGKPQEGRQGQQRPTGARPKVQKPVPFPKLDAEEETPKRQKVKAKRHQQEYMDQIARERQEKAQRKALQEQERQKRMDERSRRAQQQ